MILKLQTEIPPSINAAYANSYGKGQKGRKLTPIARIWKQAEYLKASNEVRKQGWSMPSIKTKIVVEVYAYWPDARRHDMNNAHKLLCDALEGVVYHDDKMVLVRDMDFTIDRENPRLELFIYPKEEAEHD